MKVALAFYGQPRYVKNPHILESYKKFYLDRYDCDVFCHMWWGKNQRYDVSSWAECNGQMITPDSYNYIVENYKPEIIEDEEPKSFSFDGTTKEYIDKVFTGKLHHPKHGQIWCEKNYSNILSQLYSIQKSSELVNAYSEESKTNYDFIVMARYDTILLGVPDLEKCDASKMHIPCHHPNFPDVTLFYPQKHLSWACHLFDDVELVYDKIREVTPEQFKLHSFLNKFPASDIQPCRMDGHFCRNIDDDKSSYNGSATYVDLHL